MTAVTNTVLLTAQSNRFVDSSSSAHTFSIDGTPKVSPFSPFDREKTYDATADGGSIFFDGSAGYSNYLSKGSSSDFQFGTGDFTVESWVYITGNGALPPAGGPSGNILSYSTTGSGGDGGWLFIINATTNTGDNGFGFQYWYASGSSDALNYNVNLGQNHWNHLAAVRNSNTLKLYLNGTEVASKSQSYNMTLGGTLGVGMRPWTPNNYKFPLDGILTDTRVVKGTAVYTANFTPPTAPLTAITNTKLLLNGTNAGIIDKSQTVKTLTLNGNAKSSTTQTKYLTSAMYFDGTGDYLQSPLSKELELGTSDFTVEMWARLSSIGTYIPFVSLGAGANGTALHSGWTVFWYNNLLYFYQYVGGSSTSSQQPWTPSTDQWYHIAFTRSGTSLKTFIDGTQIGSTYTSTENYSAGTAGSQDLYVGRWGAQNPTVYFHLNGYLSDLRITKGLVRYTANFTPPTAALQG